MIMKENIIGMKMVKVWNVAILAMCTVVSHTALTQTASVSLKEEPSSQIKWLSWEEALDRYQVEEKKILIDVYTDWCKFCKHMDNTTFRQPEVARYINEHFYPVKFDAEQRKDLEYRNKAYKYVKNGNMGYHELAAELLRGRLSFPALVFLDEDLNIIQSFVGYKTAQQLEQIAIYFATDNYKNTPWMTFQKTFKSMIAD